MKTLTYGDALTYVGQFTSRAKDDATTGYALRVATSYLWNRADWRETIIGLPPFYLYPGAQDHGHPAVVVPTDFHGLREVNLVYMLSDFLNRTPLKVQRNLEVTSLYDIPRAIAYKSDAVNDRGGFRIWPRFPIGMPSTMYVIDGTYKKRAPSISPAATNTVLPWDDEYFHVYCAVLFWALMPPGEQKNKALQEAEYFIADMMDKEGLNEGDPLIAPEEPLVDGWMRL